MKVLLVNTSDHTGGAAIAALRLLRALRKAGVDAKLLCRDRTLPESRAEIISLKPTIWRRAKFVVERLEIFLRNGFSRDGLFSVDTGRAGNDITRLKEFREADVIHLHWVNQAMLSLNGVRNILRSGKRVVWTMHDMWPFTGVCHSSGLCQKWLTGCGLCPALKRPGVHDVSGQVFLRKKEVYASGSMCLVGCSKWISGLASRSPLLKNQTVATIPNPIDTSFYAPPGTDHMPTKEEMRRELGLPQDRKLLLFAAFKVTDPKKGIDYLMESVSMLIQQHPDYREKLGIVLAGQGAWTLRESFPIPVYPMGYVSGEERMRQIYQATDLLLMPTLMDNLPNTIVEAMACGVPCVAFGVGGVTQMINTGINGYLVPQRDSLCFSEGIWEILESASYQALCRNARTKAVNVYSEKTVAEKYLQLYKGERPV